MGVRTPELAMVAATLDVTRPRPELTRTASLDRTADRDAAAVAGAAPVRAEAQADVDVGRVAANADVQLAARTRALGDEATRRAGLEATPQATPTAARGLAATTLKKGATGENVRALQDALRAQGFDPGTTDGQFGPKTDRAVRDFQRAKGLGVDGVVGPRTREALGAGGTNPGGAQTTDGANTDGANTAGGVDNPTTPAGPRGTGLDRKWRGFREVDEAKLREQLPAQAKDLAPAFIEAGRKNNIDPLVLVAISKHETGNFTSSAFRNKNNAMGVSNSRGPISFSSKAASIDSMARSLARPDGYYKNTNTIREMWGVYAPGTATGQGTANNDPNNLNRSWGGAVGRNADALERALFPAGNS